MVVAVVHVPVPDARPEREEVTPASCRDVLGAVFLGHEVHYVAVQVAFESKGLET